MDRMDVDPEPAVASATIHLKTYTGAFSWKWDVQRQRLKASNDNYDIANPATFLLISDETITQTAKLSPLPGFAAYTRFIIEECVVNRTVEAGAGYRMAENGKIWHVWCYYPFNFTKRGELREHPEMSAEEYNDWVKEFSRGSLQAIDAVDGDDTPAPANAYEEVMHVLAQNTLLDVDKVKEELVAEKRRAVVSEVRRLTEKQRADKAEDKLAAVTQQLAVATRELDMQGEQLVETRKELVEANARIMNIWAGMKKASGSS